MKESEDLSTKRNECYAIDDTTEFNNCMSGYNTSVSTYNKKAEEFKTKFKNFTPAYDDSKWNDISSTSKFTTTLSLEKDSYICLYGKLATADGQTILDKKFYKLSKTTTDTADSAITNTNPKTNTTTTKTSSSTEESQEKIQIQVILMQFLLQ